MRRKKTVSSIITLSTILLASAFGCSDKNASSVAEDDPKTGGDGTGGGSDSVDTCGAERTRCDGSCVELESDPDHCGACGKVCTDSEVCSRGACTDSCETGESNCDRACVDTNESANHCGACNNACSSAELCSEGVCEEVPDSRDVPDPGEPDFDPSVDPGVHPAFIDDPDLTRHEDYVYVATEAGDHDLADGISAINYDVSGQDNLRTVLSSHLETLQSGHGLALYLLNGTELNDEDLDFLQMLHSESEGLGLDNLDTLHVYNLRSLRGGVESTTETAYGIPYPFLWENGWQSPDSEIMKSDGGWVKHIVMDDLEEIKDGTFCDTMFESMSFKGVKIVRQMGLGFAPRAPATYLYMPSLEEAEMHAFRRRQRILKYNFPKLKHLGNFAIDDNSRVQYINAPSLETTSERNSLNDPRDLIAFNYPKVEYFGLSCMGGTNETTTVFRFPSMINFDGSSLRGHSNVRFLWAPKATRFGPNLFIGNSSLTDVYAPLVEDVGRYAFQDCTSLTHIELPSATRIRFNAFQGATSLEEARFPLSEQLENELFKDVSTLKRVYLGDTPPEQGSDVFTGTSPDLIIYYTGDDPGWADWTPVGNESAQVVKE